MTIEEIYSNEKISVRSYHICMYNNLYTINDLNEYYIKHKSFSQLRNCGIKSNLELIKICIDNQGEYYALNQKIKKENNLESIIADLSRIQRDTINSFIFININDLSVRSKNAINFVLSKNLKIKNFAKQILLNENFDSKNIKNIGAKSIIELNNFITNVKDFLIEISHSKDDKYLISLKNKFLIQKTFSITKVPIEILESESIFLFTNFLINQEILFDKNRNFIFVNAIKIYHNQSDISLEDIALEADISRERES